MISFSLFLLGKSSRIAFMQFGQKERPCTNRFSLHFLLKICILYPISFTVATVVTVHLVVLLLLINPKIKAGIRKQIPNPHNVKANPGSIYMPLLSSFCMTLIQYIISGRNSAHSSLSIDQYSLKDGLSFRHLYRSGVLRRRSRRF